MEKQANPGMDNSVTRLPIPLIGDINNRRFVTAVLAGLIGGAGVSSAANLLRSFREAIQSKKKEDTNEDTIVLTLPEKAAADGYTSMRDAKCGETKITTNGSSQFRNAGKFGKRIDSDKKYDKVEKESVKCSEDGNPGPNTVGTVVANALGLTAGGLLSYEVVSRIFDRMNERRLKRKLEAAQQAYVNAMTGASKRAEAILTITDPVERVICKSGMDKKAGIFNWASDQLPEPATDMIRYPAALYILGLLAGTGASAFVTKKVLDREFPEEKIKKDINRPTRIIFRTSGSRPELLEERKGEKKQASAEVCAGVTAMLPIYMDIVEGVPSRTLAAPYVKIASAAGTDSAGLMKIAASDAMEAYSLILREPRALWDILKGTNFGLSYSHLNAAKVLKATHPDLYRRAVDSAIDAHFSGGPNDGFISKAWNSIGKATAKAFATLGGRDYLVEKALSKTSGSKDTFLRTMYLGDTILGDKNAPKDEEPAPTEVDDHAVVRKAKRALKSRRGVEISAADKDAAKYISKNKERIKRLLERLNAGGTI